jgi:hypothetical protein
MAFRRASARRSFAVALGACGEARSLYVLAARRRGQCSSSMQRGVQVVGRPRHSSVAGGPVGDASANREMPAAFVGGSRGAAPITMWPRSLRKAAIDPSRHRVCAARSRCAKPPLHDVRAPRRSAPHRTDESHGQEPVTCPRARWSMMRRAGDAAALLRCLAAGLWAWLAAGLWACLAAKTYTPVLYQRFEGDRERTPGRSRV